MKRGALVALLVLLALLVVSSTTAAATAGSGAQAPSFAKKGKKKGCKKKGKKKKGCKGKGNGKGKPKGKGPQGTPAPGGGAAPQPTAPGATWPPVDGVYADGGHSVEVKIEGNGSSAFVRASNAAFCTYSIYTSPKPTTVTATTLTAGGEEKVTPVAGEGGTVKWSLSMGSDLSYSLTVDSTLEGKLLQPCDKSGTVVKGTLAKIG